MGTYYAFLLNMEFFFPVWVCQPVDSVSYPQLTDFITVQRLTAKQQLVENT